MDNQLEISFKPITYLSEELLHCNEVLLFSNIKKDDEQIKEYKLECVVYEPNNCLWISSEQETFYSK